MYYFFTDKITNIVHNYNKQTVIFISLLYSVYFIKSSASDYTDQDKYLQGESVNASEILKFNTCLLEEQLFSILVNKNFETSNCRYENFVGT